MSTAPQQSVGLLVDESLIGASEETDLSQGIELMGEAGVRRLLVRDDQGHLAGIVSFDDLIHACATELGALADVVRKGIQRETLEAAEAPAAATILHLPVPALGTAGWQMPTASVASAK